MKRIVWHISRATRRVLVALVVLVALALSLVRLFAPMVDGWRVDLEKQLSAIVHAPVSLGELTGAFHHFNPALGIKSLVVYQPLEQNQPGLEFYDLILELDTLKSLFSMTPVFRRAVVGRGNVSISAHDDRFALAGYPQPPGSVPQQKPSLLPSRPNYRAFYDVLAQQQIDFRNISFSIQTPDGDTRIIEAQHISLSGSPSVRKMSAIINIGENQPVTLSLTTLGQGRDWPDVYLKGYLSFPDFNFKPWLSLLRPFLKNEPQVKINQLRSGAQVWFSYTPKGWTMRGDLQMERLDMDLSGSILPPLSNLNTDFTLTFGHKQPAKLWLNNFSFQFFGLTYPESDLYLSYEKPERTLLIAADKVHLQPLGKIVHIAGLLPEKLDGVIRDLAPKGSLEKLVVELKPDSQPFGMELSATLKDVSVEHWREAPSGANINGRVRATAFEGVIELDSPGLELGLENIFEDVWVFDKASGLLSWRIRNNEFKLRSENIALKGGEGDIKVRLRLDVPFPKEIDNWLALEAGITNGDLAYISKYLPVKNVLSPPLGSWLQNGIKGGTLHEGGFIINGSLVKGSGPGTMAWGLFADVSNTDFFYSPDWPELKAARGRVLASQDVVEVDIEEARLYDSAKATNLDIDVTNLQGDEPLKLTLTGAVTAKGGDALRLLQESPLATAMNHAADSWKITGPLRADLDLRIPINISGDEKRSTKSAGKSVTKKKPVDDIEVAIDLSGNSLVMPDIRLQLSELTGNLHFSNKKGLYGQRLKGRVQGEPATATISSKVTGSVTAGAMTTRVAVNGAMSSKKLGQWLESDISSMVSGRTSYQADVVLGKNIDIALSSSLKGMALSLPEPLAKSADQSRMLKVRMDIDSGQPVLADINLAPSASSGSRLRSLMQIGTGGNLERIGIQAGDGVPALPSRGVFVSGTLDSLSLSPWIEWWSHHKQDFIAPVALTGVEGRENSGAHLLDWVRVKNLRINRLLGDSDEILTNAQVNLENKANNWLLSFNSTALRGHVTIPHQTAKPLDIVVDRVVIPSTFPANKSDASAEDSSNSGEQSDTLAAMDPKSIPAMNVRIKSVLQADQPVGSLSFTVNPFADGVRIPDLKGSLVGMNFDAELLWSEKLGEQMTVFSAFMKTGHIENVLKLFGYPTLFTARRFEHYTKLYWPGSPMNFSLGTIVGNMGLKMRDGNFDTSGASGADALRLFGVLNLDAITRRLRLDFSDLYRDGMTFDRLDGKASITKGNITLTEPITVRGPSSDFKLGGQLNAKTKELDLGLVVTLPVTQNIAVVSLLLGQPYIAGAAYLFDKLLGSQMEQFASLRYEIGGSFENPDVGLDTLFSNRAKGSNKAVQ